MCRLGSEAVGSLSALKGGRVIEMLSIRLAKVIGREAPNMEMGLAAQTDHVWASLLMNLLLHIWQLRSLKVRQPGCGSAGETDFTYKEEPQTRFHSPSRTQPHTTAVAAVSPLKLHLTSS